VEAEGNEENTEQNKVENKLGRTKYRQRVRSGEKCKEGWTEEEENREYQLKGIVQEIELGDGGTQYWIQFEGFTKLSDTRWFDEERVKGEWPEMVADWERKKKTYGVETQTRKTGTVRSIRRK
jgi:hypothetical protein